MIDISVTAQKMKARPDPYAPLELSNEGPLKLAGQAMLSDRQETFLGSFIVKHLPRRQHAEFRRTVLSKLSAGMPGDYALRAAIALAMGDFGATTAQIEKLALGLHNNINTRRAGIKG